MFVDSLEFARSNIRSLDDTKRTLAKGILKMDERFKQLVGDTYYVELINVMTHLQIREFVYKYKNVQQGDLLDAILNRL